MHRVHVTVCGCMHMFAWRSVRAYIRGARVCAKLSTSHMYMGHVYGPFRCAGMHAPFLRAFMYDRQLILGFAFAVGFNQVSSQSDFISESSFIPIGLGHDIALYLYAPATSTALQRHITR